MDCAVVVALYRMAVPAYVVQRFCALKLVRQLALSIRNPEASIGVQGRALSIVFVAEPRQSEEGLLLPLAERLPRPAFRRGPGRAGSRARTRRRRSRRSPPPGGCPRSGSRRRSARTGRPGSRSAGRRASSMAISFPTPERRARGLVPGARDSAGPVGVHSINRASVPCARLPDSHPRFPSRRDP